MWSFHFKTAGQNQKIEITENRESSILFPCSKAKIVSFPTDFSQRPQSQSSLPKYQCRTSPPSLWEGSCYCITWFLSLHIELLFLLSVGILPLFFAAAKMIFGQLPWSFFCLLPSVFNPSLPGKFCGYLINLHFLCPLFNWPTLVWRAASKTGHSSRVKACLCCV